MNFHHIKGSKVYKIEHVSNPRYRISIEKIDEDINEKKLKIGILYDSVYIKETIQIINIKEASKIIEEFLKTEYKDKETEEYNDNLVEDLV